ncbi:Clavata3/ESR (CLE) gene family member MtCLE21 [Medicago truncatula]|nr:Clavata3/ESR (CLE) gene family member MtCLE21 [Medicago truncatula]
MMRLMSLFCFLWFLLLVLFLFNTSFSAQEYAKSQNFRTKSMSKFSPNFQAKGGSRQNSGEEGNEDVLGDEKRKIYTGPNPLHNR